MLGEWIRSKRLVVERQMAYLHKLRLRALGILVGLGLTALGIVSMTTAPAWPVVVGAVAVAALVVNKVAAQLSHTVCIGCGKKIDDAAPVGVYGVVCPNCGTISASSRSEPSDEHVSLDESLAPIDDVADESAAN